MTKHGNSVASVLLISALLGLGACMKTDPASVAEYVKEQILAQFAEASFDEAGEGEIGVLHKDGDRQVVDIAPIQEACKRVPRSCGSLVGRVLVVMQEGLDAQSTAISIAQIQPIISAPRLGKALVQQNQTEPIYLYPIAEGLGVWGIERCQTQIAIRCASQSKSG